jgi:hypothetical protein
LPKGKLHIQFTDLRGTALNAKVELGFQRMSGDLGVGGECMEAFIKMGSETDAIISNLACRGGPGTMYRLSASVPHYRDYSFFQLDSSPSSTGISKTAFNLSTTFKSAGNSLHTPPAGFSMRRSFKSRDAHANIELMFMVENATGRLAADIDIDESSGIEHGLEVIPT